MTKDCAAEGHQGLEKRSARGKSNTRNISSIQSVHRFQPSYLQCESDYRGKVHVRDVLPASVAPDVARKFTRTEFSVDEDEDLELLRISKVECGTQTSPLGPAASIPTASSSANRRVTVKEVVKWFSTHRKRFKVSKLYSNGTSPFYNFWKCSGHEKHQEFPQLRQGSAKSGKLQSGERRAPLQEMRSDELQKLRDYRFVALAKHDLQQLEAEIKLCCRDNAALHGRVRQEMESVIEEAFRTIKQGGDMNISHAIEYNNELLKMQRKFENLSCSLQKAKVDLASVKKICVQTTCRCWWCRGSSDLRQLISMY